MNTDRQIKEEDIKWLEDYRDVTSSYYHALFRTSSDRFRNHVQFLARFSSAAEEVRTSGWQSFRAANEAHNELCIAAALLENAVPRFTCLEYEPPLSGCSKTIDFRAIAADGLIVYIDVKTIEPRSKDRWDHFVKMRTEGRFPDNIRMILNQQWLGGEIWHNKFTARSRMLEHTQELERKIYEASLQGGNVVFVLALCGERFHWHESELEDFVSYYYLGKHHFDDPYEKMEERYVQENGISFARSITSFACLHRKQNALRYTSLNWNVQPPRIPLNLGTK
jgi:hypothetical protein